MSKYKVTPASMFTDQESNALRCACCGKDLFSDYPEKAMIQFSYDADGNLVRCVPCCKGECDQELTGKIAKGLTNKWSDLSDYLNPYFRLRKTIGLIKALEEKKSASPEAADALMDVFIKTAPYVYRQPTENDKREYARIQEALHMY